MVEYESVWTPSWNRVYSKYKSLVLQPGALPDGRRTENLRVILLCSLMQDVTIRELAKDPTVGIGRAGEVALFRLQRGGVFGTLDQLEDVLDFYDNITDEVLGKHNAFFRISLQILDDDTTETAAAYIKLCGEFGASIRRAREEANR